MLAVLFRAQMFKFELSDGDTIQGLLPLVDLVVEVRLKKRTFVGTRCRPE